MDRQAERGRRTVSAWSLTLGRDVLASALATGLATVAFTVPGHREAPVPTHAFGPTGKLVERLGDEGTDGLHRALRVYETIALLRTGPASEPGGFTVAATAPAAARTAVQARHDDAAPRTVTLLPPERPKAGLTTPPPAVVADASVPGPQPIRLLGWAVPMSERLPSRDEAIGRLASIGDTVGDLGARIVDGVRLP